MDFPHLKQLANEHGDNTLAWLRELVAAPYGQRPRRDIKVVLAARGKLNAIGKLPGNASAEHQTANLIFGDPDFATFDLSDATTVGLFGALQAQGILTAEDLAAVNKLATKLVPRWQALGFSEAPQAGDLDYAKTL